MRTLLITLWLVILAILFVVVWKKFKLDKYGLICFAFVVILLWLGGSSIINLNTLSSEVQEKISQVTDMYGDTYIRTDGDEIYINVNGEWLNLADIKIIGGLLADDIYIEYDEREIYLGRSGVVNVIKTLESLGLIE